jgi:hypothetical protein
MTDPYYAQYSDNPIISATPQKEPTNTYVHSYGYDNLGKTPFTSKPYLPVSKDSLDSIIQDTQTHGQNIAELVTHDKLTMLRATAQLLRDLIDNRSQIKKDNIASLDYKILQCGNYLLDLDVWPAFSNGMVEAKRANLGHAINRLESEKNGEITRCWSDQARLYQELLRTLAEYRAAMRRSQLLSGVYQPHLKTFARD